MREDSSDVAVSEFFLEGIQADLAIVALIFHSHLFAIRSMNATNTAHHSLSHARLSFIVLQLWLFYPACHRVLHLYQRYKLNQKYHCIIWHHLLLQSLL
jgi:hypothetical protein